MLYLAVGLVGGWFLHKYYPNFWDYVKPKLVALKNNILG